MIIKTSPVKNTTDGLEQFYDVVRMFEQHIIDPDKHREAYKDLLRLQRIVVGLSKNLAADIQKLQKQIKF